MKELYFDEMTADLYDAQYGDFSGDHEFYTGECKKAGGKILELACGAGRILIPLLQAGYDVEGLDFSRKMLDVLHEKLRKRNLDTTLYNQNMLDFKIDQKYSMIILPFSSFFILSSQDEQLKCLRNCYEHLKSGGRMIVDFFVNDYRITMQQDGKPRLMKEFEKDNKKILLFEIVSNDTLRQIKSLKFKYEFYNADGKLEKTEMRKLTLRWVYPDEFHLMAKTSGFKQVQRFGGFKYVPLTSEQQRMVAVLEK